MGSWWNSTWLVVTTAHAARRMLVGQAVIGPEVVGSSKTKKDQFDQTSLQKRKIEDLVADRSNIHNAMHSILGCHLANKYRHLVHRKLAMRRVKEKWTPTKQYFLGSILIMEENKRKYEFSSNQNYQPTPTIILWSFCCPFKEQTKWQVLAKLHLVSGQTTKNMCPGSLPSPTTQSHLSKLLKFTNLK